MKKPRTPEEKQQQRDEARQRRFAEPRQRPEPVSSLGFFVARQTQAVYHPLSRSGYGYDVRTGIYDKERHVVPFDPEENGKWLLETKKSRDKALAQRAG